LISFGFIRFLFTSNKKYNKKLIELLGFFPKNWKIYDLAFVHRSASVILPDGSIVNNERLEFLGDAVLDAVIADYLFSKYPNNDEGFLSKMRSKIVKRKHLNTLADKIGIEQFIVSNSINQNGGKYICGNALEALIGAIYIDKSYEISRKFIINKMLESNINLSELEHKETDFKSRMIEWSQKSRTEISFENQEEYPVNEHTPIFISRIIVADKILGQGKGSSKKEAEQNAAEQAFKSILPS
jgi:ribonuclease-3